MQKDDEHFYTYITSFDLFNLFSFNLKKVVRNFERKRNNLLFQGFFPSLFFMSQCSYERQACIDNLDDKFENEWEEDNII